MIANVSISTVIVPASGSIAINQVGSKLAFFSNTGTFNFSINGGGFQTGLSFLYIDFAAGIVVSGQTGKNVATPISNIVSAQFDTLILQDTSGSANTITYYVGDGAVQYANPTPTNFNKDASTYTRGNKGSGSNTDLALADGASNTFNGTDSATGKTRRAINVQNVGNTTIYLLDANGGRMATLAVGSPPYQILTSGTVTVQNIAGSGAGAADVLETFYS